jgi:hypothetical protein
LAASPSERGLKKPADISRNTTIIIPSHNIPAFKPAKTFLSEVKHKVSKFSSIPYKTTSRCQAERRGKRIRWPHTAEKTLTERTGIRRNNNQIQIWLSIYHTTLNGIV